MPPTSAPGIRAAPPPGRPAPPRPRRGLSRIQQQKRGLILEAALDAFAERGFNGTSIDRIAEGAGMSKPNVLYYFPSKEAIHRTLLTRLLDDWLAPLAAIDPEGAPLEEMLAYVARKLAMSQRMPRESRLFASEVMEGAPRLGDLLGGRLRELVDEKAALIAGWMAAGRLAPGDPRHLIFSIWALTQHYADFEAQIGAVLGPGHDPYAEAGAHLRTLFLRVLTPPGG